MDNLPVLPDYGGACIANLIPALTGVTPLPDWMPDAVGGASSVVVFVLDGLGWDQWVQHRELTPNLASMSGAAITTVAPSTTATALTSLTTGLAPGEHGVAGYRVMVAGQILNVLRWQLDGFDARDVLPPEEFQPVPPFVGTTPVVVTRSEFGETGFSRAHLRGSRLSGYRLPSAMAIEAGRAVAGGEPVVYAYYEGIDKIAHLTGLGEHYRAELAAADRLIGDMLDRLDSDTVVLVTADHGQVEVGARLVTPAPEVLGLVDRQSGEGRFRWLHARVGRAAELAERCRDAFGHQAWVATRDEVVDGGWFGPKVADRVIDLLGDVALVPFEPIAYVEPADTGPFELVGRHGSLTAAEMMVPLLAARGRA